jgi:hypothetical protein
LPVHCSRCFSQPKQIIGRKLCGSVALSQKGHLTDAFLNIEEKTTSMMRKKRSH